MWIVRAILVLVLLLLVVGFAFNNSGPDQKVAVRLEPVFSNYVGVPLLTVVFGAFVAGAALSLLLFITIYIKLAVESHSQRRRIKSLEGEVAILRNRPIEESAELIKGADRKQGDMKSPFTDS
jgi:uncharacterized membrane protein YciS (DUF1049 family)